MALYRASVSAPPWALLGVYGVPGQCCFIGGILCSVEDVEMNDFSAAFLLAGMRSGLDVLCSKIF